MDYSVRSASLGVQPSYWHCLDIQYVRSLGLLITAELSIQSHEVSQLTCDVSETDR